jgi:hypothetical protein
MGDLQTYFYLALVSLVMLTLAFTLLWVAYRSWRRFAQTGLHPVMAFLVAAGITITLLFFVLTTAGVLYGFIRYGAS